MPRCALYGARLGLGVVQYWVPHFNGLEKRGVRGYVGSPGDVDGYLVVGAGYRGSQGLGDGTLVVTG